MSEQLDLGLGGAEAAMAALTPAAPPATATETPAAEPAGTPTPAAAPETPASPEAAATPPAAPADDGFAQRIDAAIARQARQQAELAEAKAARTAAEERAARSESLLEKAKNGNVQGIVELMQATGWDADTFVTALMANDPKKPEVVRHNQLAAELAETKAKLEALERGATERDVARRVEDFKATILPTVEAGKDAYSHLLGMFEGPEIREAVAAEVIRLHQASGGTKHPTVQDAAASLEAQLRARVKRVQGLVSSAPATAEPKPKVSNATVPAPKTITNDLSASPDAAPELQTDEDRYKAAAEILRKSALGFN